MSLGFFSESISYGASCDTQHLHVFCIELELFDSRRRKFFPELVWIEQQFVRISGFVIHFIDLNQTFGQVRSDQPLLNIVCVSLEGEQTSPVEIAKREVQLFEINLRLAFCLDAWQPLYEALPNVCELLHFLRIFKR